MMRQLLQRNTACLLVALFILSAGHGVFVHADHDHGHEHGVEDCALCVLTWTVAIAAGAELAIEFQRASTAPFTQDDDTNPSRVPVYTSGQRAPPYLLHS